MGQQFSITDNAVGQHASNLDASTAQMNANLQQFISSLSSLPGVWKGTAFQSFEQVQQRWEAASRDLNSALTDIRGRVGSSAQIYDAGHAEQAAGINQINASANWDASKFRA
ncbi:MAG: WXG100 family type VII secretion target [Dermatophilaceae bacterium]